MTPENHGWNDDEETIVNFAPRPRVPQPEPAEASPAPGTDDSRVQHEERNPPEADSKPLVPPIPVQKAAWYYGAAPSEDEFAEADLPRPSYGAHMGREDPYLANAGFEDTPPRTVTSPHAVPLPPPDLPPLPPLPPLPEGVILGMPPAAEQIPPVPSSQPEGQLQAEPEVSTPILPPIEAFEPQAAPEPPAFQSHVDETQDIPVSAETQSPGSDAPSLPGFAPLPIRASTPEPAPAAVQESPQPAPPIVTFQNQAEAIPAAREAPPAAIDPPWWAAVDPRHVQTDARDGIPVIPPLPATLPPPAAEPESMSAPSSSPESMETSALPNGVDAPITAPLPANAEMDYAAWNQSPPAAWKEAPPGPDIAGSTNPAPEPHIAPPDGIDPLAGLDPPTVIDVPEPLPATEPETSGEGAARQDAASSMASAPVTDAPDEDVKMDREQTNLHLPPKPVIKVADFAWLAVLKCPNPRANQIFRLDSARMEIGRKFDASIFVDDRAVSSRHAAIRYERVADTYEFVLYDLASTNGSFVNGKNVHTAVLKDDDRIRVGETDIVFKKVGEAPAEAE